MTPTEAPFRSANVDAPTRAPIQSQKASVAESDPAIDYGIIFGAGFGALFCCTLLLFCVYCCHHRKKQKDEVNKMNIDIHKAGIVAHHVPDKSPMPGDGNPTTFTGHIQQVCFNHTSVYIL